MIFILDDFRSKLLNLAQFYQCLSCSDIIKNFVVKVFSDFSLFDTFFINEANDASLSEWSYYWIFKFKLVL